MKKIILLTYIAAVMTFTGCSTSEYYTLPSKEFSEVDYKFPVKFERVKNINVAYIDEGKGENVLLLIHGLGTNAKSWLKNITGLSKNFRVLAVDLPGYGKSDKGYYKYSMSFYADVLSNLLINLKIERATLVGHSMGGQIAMITAQNYPANVDKLVLISPAGFERFTEGEGDWMKAAFTVELVKETTTRNIDVNLRSNFFNAPDDAAFFVTDRIQIKGAKDFEDYCYAVTRNVAGMIDEPTWNKLNGIQQKTLIIFGSNDGLIPNPYLHGGYTCDIAKIGESRIPDNKTVIIPECGHMAQFEKADLVNKEIIDFLKD